MELIIICPHVISQHEFLGVRISVHVLCSRLGVRGLPTYFPLET
jgi:hypothetical protein